MHSNRFSNLLTRILALASCLALDSWASSNPKDDPVPRSETSGKTPKTKPSGDLPEDQRRLIEKLLREKGLLDPRGWNFPKTAHEYAKMVEPDLGVPPRIDLSDGVEIPLYVHGPKTPKPLSFQI